MEELIFYAFCVVIILVGVWLVKRVVSCAFRLAVLVAVIAIIAYIYVNYLM